jgi:hypothetical protein
MSISNLNPYNVADHQLKDIVDVPTNYEEAFFCPDQWCRSRWREAIKVELSKMHNLQVWHPINLKDIPTGRKPIKNKWVFDVKRNGTFRARLVACGYSQIPGIDFSEYYAPVVNDAVFRIVIIIQLLWSLSSVILDVETAFLHGELNEDIYMRTPKGVDIPNHQCVKLNKALYGQVQAERQFYLNFSGILKQIGFAVSYADPCLFHRNNHQGRIIMIVHVDDCYTIGNPKALAAIKGELEAKVLKVKMSKMATDYLSCDLKIDLDKQIAWMGQTTLIRKVINKYDSLNSKSPDTMRYKTPGTPKQQIEGPSTDDPPLSQEDQTAYRSAVGTLLQFSSKTRPDLANPVREIG